MFITFDGIDGAGKSTQIELLRAHLTHSGRSVECYRDPGSTELGEAIRDILLHRVEIPLAMTAEMLLYMSARAQLVEEQIKPALEGGKIVICDRFLLANVVYQGCAGGLPCPQLWSVGNAATGGLRPDMTIILDLDPTVAFNRLNRGHDRLEKRGLDYFQKVRNGFIEQVVNASDHWTVIQAAQPVEVVHGQVTQIVDGWLQVDPTHRDR